MSDLGALVQMYRKDCNLSQRELAKRAGISPAYVRSIENNIRTPTLNVLGNLADALDVAKEPLFQLAHPGYYEEVPGARYLSEQEVELIGMYREATPEMKLYMRTLIKVGAEESIKRRQERK